MAGDAQTCTREIFTAADRVRIVLAPDEMWQEQRAQHYEEEDNQ
jgi:hypothetical protein